ncbi:flagellar filament capping protein FliD [Inmirania thermothiophila]|uniref:Flagellar hook-associated protein 2 n=1 Tax=Inmirania thermothiophila TaxID=1750597 RepID=A0A3N1Y8Q3_9GAMM|nr:flagellar filament capping protein FliD [Inmirania thermothiophila]ROR34921.1 flagellar hook-associated protein 2 [Inmirania thermothiophila]
MASIQSLGVGSGLDLASLVTDLVAAERQPTELRLNKREAKTQATLSALGTVKSALASLRDAVAALKDTDTFTGRTATSGDTSLFTASADGDAVAGSYEIEVVQRAAAHKVRSGDFASAGDNVGTGTLTISVGGDSFTVAVDASAQTLADVRDAINAADGNDGLVSATIVHVDDGAGGTVSRLVLTAGSTGAANAISVTVADDDGNDTDAAGLSRLASANLVEIRPAADAQIRIDGQTVSSATDTFADAIDGVTITVVGEPETPGTTAELTVAVDRGAVTAAVQGFVDAYNGLVATLGALTEYSSEGASGTLIGDFTVRTLESRLRAELGAAVDGADAAYDTLVELGITTDEDGMLQLDSAKLEAAMDAGLDKLSTLFAGSDGVAVRLYDLIDEYTGSDGILDAREEGLQALLDDIEAQREALDRRMEALEERLTAQFSALDSLIAELNTTSQFLAGQLANLPGAIDSGSKR